MKINSILILLSVPVLFLFTACSVYQPIEIVPDHIRTIRIEPIKNKTQQIRLTSELSEQLIDEFTKEGRLTVLNTNNADSALEIIIIEYSKIPILYDENFVAEEFKVNMIINLKYYDLIKKVMLWEDTRVGLAGGIETWVNYNVDIGKDSGFTETEEEVRYRLVIDTAKQIMQRTVLGWE